VQPFPTRRQREEKNTVWYLEKKVGKGLHKTKRASGVVVEKKILSGMKRPTFSRGGKGTGPPGLLGKEAQA